MGLQQLKELIDKTEFSPEAKKEMLAILEEATKRGSLTPQEKGKLLGIIRLEMRRADIEADALEEMALALEAFSAEATHAAEIAASDIKTVSDEFKKDLEEAKKQLGQSSQPSPTTT